MQTNAAVPKSSGRMIASPIVASIAFVLELTLVPLLLPIIQSDYGLAIGDMAWFFNSYGVAVALGVICGGWVGDLVGVRRIFGAGVALFACGAIAIMVSDSFGALIAGRIVQGFGGGLFSPLVPILLTKALPQRPGKILIVWGSITGYVAAFAPLAMGWAVQGVGWQSVFVLFAILAGAAFALSSERMPEVDDVRGTVRRDLRGLFHSLPLWCVFGYIFCTYGAITYYLFRLPLVLSEASFGLDAIGIILAAIWLSFSISGTLLRNWVDGPRVRQIVLAAPLLILAGFTLVLVSQHMTWLVVSAVLMGAGFACSNAPSTQLVLRFAPKRLAGLSMSVDITSARLGGVLGVSLLAPLAYGMSLLGVAGLSCVALICALVSLSRYDVQKP